MQIDATRGSIGETMGKFALPYLFSYFLQTLYGMADLFIIGQFEGAASITAVSIGSQVMHMVTVMLVGLAMGTTVSIAQAVGGGKREQTAWITGNTVTFFLGSSMVLAAGLTFLVHPLAALMHTPAEAVPGTVEYLTLCFLGIPFITAYNIISAIFRGLGNSRSPMVFIAIACAANILLDCLFMGVFHMGPAGAALGTTLSQAISVAISLFMIRRYRLGITLAREQLRPRWEVIRKLLRIGVPIALQDGFIQVAFLVITVIANERGITDAAAVGIVEKIISFIFLVPSSLLSTVSALGAQNIGAHQPERARAILETALKTALGFGVLMILLMQPAAPAFVGTFTSDSAVISAGAPYLRGYIVDVLFAGVHFSFSGYFCAWGRSEFSFIHNVISIVLARIPLVYAASKAFPYTLLPMGLATACGSLVSVLICMGLFRKLRRKNACTML
ncbi:MATE family efflux transporter [Acidaminococcus fermentans]|uniref:MATE efflux family protein n=1 Tax=Acidaminococcus fermentans (strain ATCC 25085 / DSM 20731 / CCUG 9996 / CIP 106432 / VR4) TaxID=591001 RepID=D2RIY5_ACIFV|nr:MATE family efflux transporter [Acidaminococcus fermentans]ADB47037.1 MATE efflux family protein [Acidaminococcus fermentans DSM 20731]MCF0139829.1 MATE family efflux transporter [Acidaminococcus fermentans]MCI6286355.1 MATE family efflux transporter [Acidaminococcus fermentans]MDD7196373.1 MATE family efflux transporter [Acidaminococcus fermentans]MDY2852803.1 MATE family efflux transporter [Acidaminococcus fermentans]